MNRLPVLIVLLAMAIFARSEEHSLQSIRIVAHDSVPLYATVYTPPAYTLDSVYPVLYLLHGIHGNQYSWEESAHVCHLADSLISTGEILPLVIVMPLCVVHDSIYATDIPNYLRSIHDYLHHTKKEEFEPYFPEIEAYIAEHYAVPSRSRGQHGVSIAGLSSGGRQAANISKQGGFDVVGLFSPVLSKKHLPKEPSETLYWVRGGGADIFFFKARKANRVLNRKHIPHTFLRTPGGHNWHVWRRYIEDFLLDTYPPTP